MAREGLAQGAADFTRDTASGRHCRPCRHSPFMGQPLLAPAWSRIVGDRCLGLNEAQACGHPTSPDSVRTGYRTSSGPFRRYGIMIACESCCSFSVSPRSLCRFSGPEWRCARRAIALLCRWWRATRSDVAAMRSRSMINAPPGRTRPKRSRAKGATAAFRAVHQSPRFHSLVQKSVHS